MKPASNSIRRLRDAAGCMAGLGLQGTGVAPTAFFGYLAKNTTTDDTSAMKQAALGAATATLAYAHGGPVDLAATLSVYTVSAPLSPQSVALLRGTLADLKQRVVGQRYD